MCDALSAVHVNAKRSVDAHLTMSALVTFHDSNTSVVGLLVDAYLMSSVLMALLVLMFD